MVDAQNKGHGLRKNWQMVKQAWKEGTIIEKVLLTLILIPRTVSPVRLGELFVKEHRSWSNWADVYVLLWVSALVLILFCWMPSGHWAVIAAILAAWRIVEILSYQLCIVLVDSRGRGWRLESRERSFLLSVVNLFELITAFALIYASVGHIATSTQPPTGLQGSVQALYYSSVTMATLGYGEFVPADDSSRIIVMFQLLTQVLFVLAVIPTIVASFAGRLVDQPASSQPNTPLEPTKPAGTDRRC
jgi:hypothetical protein